MSNPYGPFLIWLKVAWGLLCLAFLVMCLIIFLAVIASVLGLV